MTSPARSFTASPNILFDTRVRAVSTPSPGFVRLTLHCPALDRFAPHGLDQRIKLLVPVGEYPVQLVGALPEVEWRARWRAVPAERRPVLRSYTPSAVRPDRAEIDVDVFVHAAPGPASAWAGAAAEGDRLLLSGPDVGSGRPGHGTQWRPGPATALLLGCDETSLPAVHGILAALPPDATGTLLVEVADPADTVPHLRPVPAGIAVDVRLREGTPGGTVLAGAVRRWAERSGPAAAAAGTGFYAWLATEGLQVARARDALLGAGIAADRVHAQGYWHDRSRQSA